MALPPTLFPRSPPLPGPKHSISVPFSAGIAVTLSVDEKEVALTPNPVPDVAVKALPGPQLKEVVPLCNRGHALLLPTLQVVSIVLSPPTVHLKVKVLPGQLGGAAVNCPVALSAWRQANF